MPGRREEGEKIVASNRKARHDYEILETVECGIQLTGDEVKSLRSGRASLADCYGRVRSGEVWLEGHAHPALRAGRHSARTSRCGRASSCCTVARSSGWTRRWPSRGCPWCRCASTSPTASAKVELALAEGKRRHEKRHAIAKREDAQREAERELGRRR